MFTRTDQKLICNLTRRIRDLAEEPDAHCKRQFAKYPGKNGLTLTDMYSVLEKLRFIERNAGILPASSSEMSLSAKERTIHSQGLIAILKQLHDDLDTAVLDAYNWPATLTDDQLLQNLVNLNHQRAAEESQGIIKQLRPEFRNQTGDRQ